MTKGCILTAERHHLKTEIHELGKFIDLLTKKEQEL